MTVNSSAIASIVYHARARALTVTFRGADGAPARTYRVEGVSRRQADNIRTGRRDDGSVGRAYNRIVRRGRYLVQPL